jgi:hypothetical protein
MDKEIEETEVAALQILVHYYSQKLKEVMPVWRRECLAEMVAIVETGAIPTLVTKPVDPQKADRNLPKLGPNSLITKEQLVALKQGEVEVPAVSQVIVKGKSYAMSSFGALPRSDALLCSAGFESINFLAAVLAWFEARGLVQSGAFVTVIDKASRLDGRSIRAQS